MSLAYIPYACSYTTSVAFPKYISSALYSESVGISCVFVNKEFILDNNHLFINPEYKK
jgi:hypothetical protein